MPWSLDLMQNSFLLLGCFRKGFITLLFCKWPLYTLQAAERKYTYAIPKLMKCWALFVISKTAFTETAIKTKFPERFF